MKVILSKLLPSVWFAAVMVSGSLMFMPVSGFAADTVSSAGQQMTDAVTEGDFPLLPRPQGESTAAGGMDSGETALPSESYPGPVSAPENSLPPDAAIAPPNTGTSTLVTRPASYNSLVNTNITVKDMGQPNGLLLSGGQLQSGIVFTLPNDLVITNAKLSLALKISPELASKNYNLQLMLNGQPLGAIPLNQSSDKSAVYQVDVPAAMIVATNNLSMSITGDNNALQCETDQLNKFWVSILPTSSIHLEGQQLNLGRNLGILPRPFFDIMQMKETKVAMAFPANIRADIIAAAAGVASWFGYQANYRDIDFPVQFDSLPEGNGILFGKPGEHIGDLILPESNGPSLQLIDNPINPVAKLLLVIGRNDGELRQAVWRLTSEDLPQDVSSLEVKPQSIPKSLPYDAPRWINTEHPVLLKSLVPNLDALTANGIYHDGIRVGFRAAPDLFMWDGETIPIHIGYRFPIENWIDENTSQLNVSINDTFLYNLPVNKKGLVENLWRKMGGDTRQESYSLRLAPYLIYGDNQLEFYFAINPKAGTPCNVLNNNNIKSRIEPDSYIDLSHTYHFTLLPNLSYFVGASFPFTRLADFSQTLIILPEKPSNTEVRTLLDLAARAGNSTGKPIINARVKLGIPANAQDDSLFTDNDILVVSVLEHADFAQTLFAGTSFHLENGVLSVKAPSTVEKVVDYLTGFWFRQQVEADRYLSSTDNWRGFLSFRSTWNPQKVVVMATATGDDQLVNIHGDLKSSSVNAGVRGDLAIITNENGVRSFSVGEQFPRGELPWYQMIVWYASQHIVILALLALLVSAMIGLSMYGLLKRRAALRLGKDPEK
ncbi:cellulose biosynthesis cyclic di-GMP-binding regulatory protein BcsB [Yersinia frederiksenii]|uniref:cellulose biosynthesis cyclic di-GMP-binding regulatory protein BcsB n=1 Tax=Yersinia frederiksenii TaxID=29484 RepID=UPI0020CE59F3|nr:cellulose biosynthesis cyclic di-GMP-binding regulatory protein BcsB [Yersinia frederiksenii]